MLHRKRKNFLLSRRKTGSSSLSSERRSTPWGSFGETRTRSWKQRCEVAFAEAELLWGTCQPSQLCWSFAVMVLLQVAALESLNKDLMDKNRELQQKNQELMDNKLRVVSSKEVQSGFFRSVSDGSYRLASLESRTIHHSPISLDGGLKKVAIWA